MIRGSLTTLQVLKPRSAEGRPVVRKRLREGLAHDAWLQGLLEAVGHLGMRVNAPNVVRTLAVKGAPDGFIALDHVDGASLSDLLALHHGQDVTRFVVPVLLDALAGLTALHELRGPGGESTAAVHQAPSARHMLVGVDGRTRLCDLMHASAPGLAPSVERQRFLVPAEMSPEQASGTGHIDARCDVFIVGTVLWEALTGEHLFAAGTPQDSLARVLRMPIVAPSQHGTSSFFDAVCARALMRVRVGRYGSAEEMASELRDAAQARGLCASHDEVADWVRRAMERTPGKASASHTLLKPLFAAEPSADEEPRTSPRISELPGEPSAVKPTPRGFRSSFFEGPATEARPSVVRAPALAAPAPAARKPTPSRPDSVPVPVFRADRDEREPDQDDPTRPRVISAVFGGPMPSVLSDAPAWAEEVIQGGPEPTLESLRVYDDRPNRRGWLMGAFVGASTVAILYAIYSMAFGSAQPAATSVAEGLQQTLAPAQAVQGVAQPAAPERAPSELAQPRAPAPEVVPPARAPVRIEPASAASNPAPAVPGPRAAQGSRPHAPASAVRARVSGPGVPENPY